MKYIINESRLDEVIMNYLDSIFFGMKEHHEKIGYGIYQWWGNGDYWMMYIDKTYDADDAVLSVGINDSVWSGLVAMFNLSPVQTEQYLKRWIRENLEINPDEIYVF